MSVVTTVIEHKTFIKVPITHSNENTREGNDVTLIVKVDLISLKHALKQHQHVVITSADDEDVQRIHVRRSHVFEYSMRQDTFNVTKILKVVSLLLMMEDPGVSFFNYS